MPFSKRLIAFLLLSVMGGCDRRDIDQEWGLGEQRELKRSAMLPTECGGVERSFSFVLPLGVDRKAVALAACSSLTVGEGAVVKEEGEDSDSGSLPHLFITSAGGVSIGREAHVPSIYALGA